MVTWKQVIEEYGEDLAEQMIQTGLLDGITCVMLPPPPPRAVPEPPSLREDDDEEEIL